MSRPIEKQIKVVPAISLQMSDEPATVHPGNAEIHAGTSSSFISHIYYLLSYRYLLIPTKYRLSRIYGLDGVLGDRVYLGLPPITFYLPITQKLSISFSHFIDKQHGI
jgi:hypothetical protein